MKNFSISQLSELRIIVEKEHEKRIYDDYGNFYNQPTKKIKEGIKEDEKNPFTSIGKTYALLEKIQLQMDKYNKQFNISSTEITDQQRRSRGGFFK